MASSKKKAHKGRVRGTVGAVRSGRAPGMGRPGKAGQREVNDYRQLAAELGPRRPLARNALAAFLVGGIICAVGEGIRQLWLWRGVAQLEAYNLTAASLVVISAVLTGLGVYDLIGAFGGMGSAIPITGFANAIVAPALEYKREGFVLGVGARLFQIAGPVIVYGTLVAIVVASAQALIGGIALP
jgi:stage V sporulation protein AC